MSAPFDASVNLIRALLWRDSNALKFHEYVSLKSVMANAILSDFWVDWVRDVFDVDTANDFGLAIWGRLLDVKMQVGDGVINTDVPFGFSPFGYNFSNGNFSVSASGSGSIQLTTEQKRILIKMRLYQLTGRMAVFSINEFLVEMFGEGVVKAVDNFGMQPLAYAFASEPPQYLSFILNNFDILPRPAGVGATWIVAPRPTWRFDTYALNYDRGNFGA